MNVTGMPGSPYGAPYGKRETGNRDIETWSGAKPRGLNRAAVVTILATAFCHLSPKLPLDVDFNIPTFLELIGLTIIRNECHSFVHRIISVSSVLRQTRPWVQENLI